MSRKNIGSLSLREISALIPGENSAQNIKHHLRQLSKKGLIVTNKSANIIQPVQSGVRSSSNIIAIPILGSANCGEALTFARENLEGHLQVSTNILGEKWVKKAKHLFALHAVGPSMNKAKGLNYPIEEGDYILIDETNKEPSNGDYVLSIINGCANIKRYFEDKSHHQIALISESTENIPPIYIHEMDKDDYLINGKVALVIKDPENWTEFGVLDESEVTPEMKKNIERAKNMPRSSRTNL
jgi:SOS-response transcriptional repressor LexA